MIGGQNKKLLVYGIRKLLSSPYVSRELESSSLGTQEQWDNLRSSFIRNFNYFDPDDIFSFNPDQSLDHESTRVASTLFSCLLKESATESDLKGWRPFVFNLASSLGNDSVISTIRNSYSREESVYLLASCFFESTNWQKLFDEYVRQYVTYYGLNANQSLIAGKYAETKPDLFSEFMDTYVFGKNPVGHYHRAVFYKKHVEAGLLDKKGARKIRSDGSEQASLSGLRALVKNSNLYANFDELITQFVDTRYPDVSLELARELPVNMLSFLAGCDHYQTKRCVERRIEKHLNDR